MISGFLGRFRSSEPCSDRNISSENWSGTGMYSPIPGIESGEEAWGEQLTPPAQFFNRDNTNTLTRLPIL